MPSQLQRGWARGHEYVLIDWVGPNSVNKHFIIWPPRFSFFFNFFFNYYYFLLLLIFFSGNKIRYRNVHLRRLFWPKSWDLNSNKVGSHLARSRTLFLEGPDGFFRPCSRHRVRASYGDFLNSFAMKARAGPYGSYDKYNYALFHLTIIPRGRVGYGMIDSQRGA